MATNMFEELKTNLEELKEFLDKNVSIIKEAVNKLGDLIPGFKDLIDNLIKLLNEVKTAIDELDVSNIPGLDEASAFTGLVSTLLDTAVKLDKKLEDTVKEVRDVTDVVVSLPSLDELKDEISGLLDAILGHLATLKG